MSSIRSILEDLIETNQYIGGNVYKPAADKSIDQALLEISQIIDEKVIGKDETVISQHYMAGNIEERTAFPDRRNRLRAKQRKSLKEALK